MMGESRYYARIGNIVQIQRIRGLYYSIIELACMGQRCILSSNKLCREYIWAHGTFQDLVLLHDISSLLLYPRPCDQPKK